VTNKTSVIVMTLVGNAQPSEEPPWRQIEALPAPPGCIWRFVPDGPLAIQARSILRINARLVVVWVGADDAVHRAAKLIGRLLEAGLPIVIAIAEVHEATSESALRQAGAFYICANEAQTRLGTLLESILGPPARAIDAKTTGFTQEVNMDAS
jgi:hypothetical protein